MDTATDTLPDIRTAAEQVALELGDGWIANDGDQLSHLAYLDGPDDARLAIRYEWNRKHRVAISGYYPDAPYGVVNNDHHSITVNAHRGPETVAKEIRRRLLPGYLPDLEDAKAAIAKHHADTAAANTLAAELGAILDARVTPADSGAPGGSGIRRRQAGVSIYSPGKLYGSLNVDRYGVSVELSHVTADQARAIARILVGSDAA